MTDLRFILDFVATALWHVGPAFLVSILLGVLVRALGLDGTIRRAFGAQIGLAILLATLVGAFSPFCSCTVIPLVSGLLLSGVPLAPVMAFWIASPTMDPEIFALSVATIGWSLAVARLAATLAISLSAGYVTLALTRAGYLRHPLRQRARGAESPAPASVPPVVVPATPLLVHVAPGSALAYAGVGMAAAPAAACTATSCTVRRSAPAPLPGWWRELVAGWQVLAWENVGREVLKRNWSLGRWLLLAFVLEALIVRSVPQTAIAGVLGHENPFAVALAALIGVPLYLGNIGALPIVSGLLAQGMQPGAAIAFLVAGPVTTMPAMTAVWGLVRREVFALYLAIGVVGAMLAGVFTTLVM